VHRVTAAPAAVASVRLDTVVLDCPDPTALARFYAALLGRRVDPDGDATWQSLTDDGSGVTLAFQRAEKYVAPAWPDGAPQQLHLDLTVKDMVAAHARAVELGAVLLDPQDAPTGNDSRGFRVYADPAGHPFCLCR
jgi:catechol 2,3-dioxygenase-like lactoylglutathione lyase family enzyme